MGDQAIVMGSETSNVALFQFNPGFYANKSYLPYSVGMLWAYAQSFPEIKDAYRNVSFHFIRQDPELLVERMEHVDVAAFSTYLWNWKLNTAVAVALKKRFPKILTIFGGPHMPNDAKSFLERHMGDATENAALGSNAAKLFRLEA